MILVSKILLAKLFKAHVCGSLFFKTKNRMVNNINLGAKKRQDIIFNPSIDAISRVIY
jgi:hypothetical protein